MLESNLYIPDVMFDSDEEHLRAVEVYLQQQNLPDSSKTRSQGLFLTDHDMDTARLNDGAAFSITPAYKENGEPNYLDSDKKLRCGIYSGLENEVYHSLPAISSSQIKKYAKSPAHYKRAYIDTVNRRRLSKATERTFDAGTYSHELILEPEFFYDRYFRLLNAVEHENCIDALADLKKKCETLGLPLSGAKAALVARIHKADPTVKIFDIEQKNHVIINAGESAVTKALEIMSVTARLGFIDALRHEDVKPLLKKTPIDPIVWDDAHRASETVRSHEWANEILQNGFAELSVIALCPETGKHLKVRFDWINKNGVPADVKTTRSANPFQASYQFGDLGYDLQGYMYSYVGRLAGIPCPERVFPFICVEYLDADICEVFELCESDWEIAERNFHKHIKNLASSLETNTWSGYTNRNGSTLLRLPKRGRV